MRLTNKVDYFWTQAKRRRVVLLKNLTFGKCWNIFKLLYAFTFKKTLVNAYPVLIKMDVTPLCQLKCPVCIHDETGINGEQLFKPEMMMSLSLFKKVVDEVQNKTLALSLYHMGEPLLNKELPQMCLYATSRGINTYATSNFSMRLTDKYMEELIKSGLSLIVVCLDGFSQATYEENRVGGDIELVKKNLRRFMEIKKRLKSKSPFVEVQSLLFERNLHERSALEDFCSSLQVDNLSFIEGSTTNFAVSNAKRSNPRKKGAHPLCKWLYFGTVVLYDGDIVPCCKFRLDNTYSSSQERVLMGNINEKRFLDIFNNDAYRNARRLAADPVRASGLEDNFCFGCRFLYTDNDE